MTFCPNCGAPVEGRFCAKCGAAATAAGGPAVPGPDVTSDPVALTGMPENVVCTLCYLFTVITGILFLVLEPYNRNRNIRFHAFQSIFFGIAAVVAWVVLITLSTILLHIPILGWMLGFLLWTALGIGALICWLMLMYKAYNNQRFLLPVIGPLAEKQA
jgi:uncharacterized membrane protein